MKNTNFFAILFACLLVLFGCQKETPTIEPKPEPEPVADVYAELSNPIIAQYQNGEGYDVYNMILASGQVVFDEINFQWRTDDEGWVMILSLCATQAADPTHPDFPEGKYVLGSTAAPGVWNSDPTVNYLTYYTVKDGVTKITPQTGEIEVKKTADGYTVKALFEADDQKLYSVTYNGALTFPGVQAEAPVIEEPINTEFIAGQAVYKGADDFAPEWGYVQLELWDSEPEGEWGTIYGNFMKIKLFIPQPSGVFSSMPSGTWELSYSVGDHMAEVGYDSGEGIPTGSYVAQTLRDGSTVRTGLLESGTITITPDKHVIVDMCTKEGVSVKGRLNKPLGILDLGSGTPSQRYSTLTSDKTINLSGTPTAYFIDYGDYYNNGTRNVVLQVLDGTTMTGMMLDLVLPAAPKWDPIPDCTCTVDRGMHGEYTFAPGAIAENVASGTWGFFKMTQDGNIVAPDFSEAGNAVGGAVKIVRNGEQYTLTVDFVDDASTPHKMQGSWTGSLIKYDYGGASAAVNAVTLKR